MPHALVVDDDPSTLTLLARLLEQRGFSTRTAASLAEARESLDPSPDVCMLDLRLPDGEGIELLHEGLAERSDVIMLTGYATIESSVQAMRRGARDYLSKPLTRIALDRVLARFSETGRADPTPRRAPPIIGESPQMKQLQRALTRIGPSDATVLIIGESGTGKELIAAKLHELSPRSRGRYLALNCGAVSPNLIESELFGHEKGSFTGASRQHAGYFERAHGGTLFLDEITEMPMDLQVRLLRVLENRCVSRVGSSETLPINVRVIAATNRDPREAVQQRKLREDLLYRLQVVPVEVPPLRARKADAALLAHSFVRRFAAEQRRGAMTLLPDAIDAIESHPWPGNVRELENVIKRAVIMADGAKIGAGDVGLAVKEVDGDVLNLRQVRDEAERAAVVRVLARVNGNLSKAAEMLGVSRPTLYDLMDRFGLR